MLHLLLLQLKANVSSVLITLDEGQHGYVGVIISPVMYATLVPIQPFFPLLHPVHLNVVHLTSQ